MPNYDTNYIIDQVKRRASIPTSQNLFTNQKFIVMINDELKTRIVPTLMALRDDWYSDYTEYTADGATTTYTIPADAVGNKLKSVTIWDNGKQVRVVPRLNTNDLQDSLYGFYVENNSIIFYPNPIETNKTIRLSYFKRTDDLVDMSEAGYISLIAGNDVTISTTLPTTFINGASVQVVNNQNPFNVIWSGTISNIAGSVVTLSSTPTGVTIGNYLCLQGETVFPNIPVEMFPLLSQSIVVKCLEALGDDNGMQSAMANLQQIEFNCKQTLSPKIDGNPKRMMGKNNISRYI